MLDLYQYKANERISMHCHNCGNAFDRKVISLRVAFKKFGKFVCHSCKTKTSEYRQKQLLAHPKIGSKWNTKVDSICSICGGVYQINYRTKEYYDLHNTKQICKSCSLKARHINGGCIYDEQFKLKLAEAGVVGRMKSHEWWHTTGRIKATAKFLDDAITLHGEIYDYSRISYKDYYTKIVIICPKHGEFRQTPDVHLRGSGCQKCAATQSRPQIEVHDFICSITDATTIINDRAVIAPYEIDILIPDKKIGLEVNGIYWHSYDHEESAEERNRHAHKKNMCAGKGINLIQITDHEWINKRSIVESRLSHVLGKSQRIYARQCVIKEIDNNSYEEFMNKCHIQGHKGASIKYGLLHDNKLVAVMSFNKHPKQQWEITRFANELGCSVVGGASKLFQHFIRSQKPSKILTYADRRYSNGNLYKQLGFELDGITRPNYVYVKNNQIFSRQHFQKHKLLKLLENFDSTKTEADNMFLNGYRRLWDAGHFRFVWKQK